MVRKGDTLKKNRLAGRFYASQLQFTGFYLHKVSGGVQLVKFTQWESEDGTIYDTDTVADASEVFPNSAFRRFVEHHTGNTIYYGYLPAAR